MIIDTLSHFEKYMGDGAIAKLIANFAERVNTATELKRYDLDGERIFALVQEYKPRELCDAKVEIHRRYIDIHVPVSGDEMICYCPIVKLEMIEDFTPKSDDVLYKMDPLAASKLLVPPGAFVWFDPGEGHSPCLKVPGSPPVCRKIVFKVDAALFEMRAAATAGSPDGLKVGR